MNIELVPGGNVEAPDPQDMIDLEVCSHTHPLYAYIHDIY